MASSVMSAARALGHCALDRVDDLGPARVVERHVESHARPSVGCANGLGDRGAGRLGQLVQPAKYLNTHALPDEIRRLTSDRRLEQSEQVFTSSSLRAQFSREKA